MNLNPAGLSRSDVFSSWEKVENEYDEIVQKLP